MKYWQHEETGATARSEYQPSHRWFEIPDLPTTANTSPTGQLIQEAGRAKGQLALLLGVPTSWDEIVGAVKRLKVTLCGNCGVKFIGESQSEDHGFGKCGMKPRASESK